MIALDVFKKEFAASLENIYYPGTPEELAAWAPPEDITVSQWASKYRILPKSSAIPGRWNNRLVPYAVGVMDAFNSPWVEKITIMASVQSAKTESVYNMLGYAVCQDPAPAVIVMPTLNTMKRVNRRIRKMMLVSEELSSHLTSNPDDLQLHQIILDRMEIYFATAGSDADLQNVEARYVICDETDEYPQNTEQGDLVEKAIDRSTTYWNRKIVLLSRPTMLEGYINKSYEKSDKRKYWVPCPFCKQFQTLSFWQIVHQGEELGQWPKMLRDPDYIRLNRVARYVCSHCGEEIDDSQKLAMLAAGKWVPEGHEISPDGSMPPVPDKSHVGFHWNVLYSPFRTFSEIAAQFFVTKDDRDQYRIFVNQWLAEPWREIIKQKNEAAILDLRTSRPPLIVPDGTVAITAGVDNQRRGCYCSVWAWVRLESGLVDQHLIRYGFLHDFAELEIWLFQDVYSTADGSQIYPVWRAAIDTGGSDGDAGDMGMTEQVYQWLRLNGRGRVFGVKGASMMLKGGKKMQMSIIDKMPGRGLPIPGGLRLWILDTNALKDSFWSRVESGRVHLHAETDATFANHLTAEAKERDKRGRYLWVLQGRRANHFLDTAVYALAMADPECWGGIMVLPSPEQAEITEEHAAINPLTGLQSGAWLER
jgi:phage terminase large subunit GpA-like protein